MEKFINWIKSTLGLTKIVNATYYKKVLTVTWSDGAISTYYGEGSTVWYHYPSMKRCSTNTEYTLAEVMTYIKEFGNPYPTAHLNKK